MQKRKETPYRILRIRAFLKEKGFRTVQISKMTGVHECTVRRFMRAENYNPQIDCVEKLEALVPTNYFPKQLVG
jgi:hypothetical protein